MAANPNWPRWIFASFTTMFQQALQAALPSIGFFVEGQDRQTNTQTDFVEVRMNGPDFSQCSPSQWDVQVQFNVLVQSIRDEKDFHKIHRTIGAVLACFPTNLTIYRYGDGTGDDQGVEGCLITKSGSKNDGLIVSQFGQVQPDVPVMQA